ncbi:hypothetical protein SCYAM73S_01109 [Streptomyces cyaneofuscatus]
MVECSVTAVKPAVPRLLTRGAKSRRRKNERRSVEEIAAAMTPGPGLRVWKAHGFSRAVGLCLLVVQGGGIWAMLDDGPSWSWLWLPVALSWLISTVATTLTWRITADRDGLWVTGAWRVRRAEWDAITAVRHHEDGIRIGTGKGHDNVDLAPTGWACWSAAWAVSRMPCALPTRCGPCTSTRSCARPRRRRRHGRACRAAAGGPLGAVGRGGAASAVTGKARQGGAEEPPRLRHPPPPGSQQRAASGYFRCAGISAASLLRSRR